MGRVFDAIRKSSATSDNGKAPKRDSKVNERRNEEPRISAPLPSARDIEEQLFAGSSIMTVGTAAPGSASSAHTTDVPDGSALPGGIASRDAGATLDAAGATRAGGFVSYDISPARVEPHLVAVSQPRSAYCEQFRALRTRILQAGEKSEMRSLVVTSSGIAEGKTLTALNLGWLLAQTEGVRALVIDSDLRRPCATDYFGIDAKQGLSEVLGAHIRLEDAIVRLDPAGLHLLPGGKPRDDVAELLSGPTYERVLAQARRMFDYIIIDAPPLGIFTDANVLMSRADGALLVVRAGKTRYSLVDKLLEQIPREKVLGVVLNRAGEQPESNNYYYQYRYSNRETNSNGSKKKALAQETREEEVAVVN
ncbi:MAG TPA: CpsD/CapB family tyrosine-protein kinase [Pyrinomonadaceae bacterium]|nr:CpsD/CapB family tyrosine-protein kinase [Pyrinomonadaceae bacterium]